MAARNVPGTLSQQPSSSSAAPLAGTTGSGSVRPRNRRPPNNGNSRGNFDTNLTRNHDDVLHSTQRPARNNTKGNESTPGLGQVLGGSWAQSWSTVQGFAASLLSVAETSSGNGSASNGPNSSTSSGFLNQRAVNRVATGSSDQREAALKTAKRASVLENSHGPSGRPDVSGKYKRRTSDEIGSESSQPEEYLVYIHKVLPTDTYAGIILRYKCVEDVFRKANGLWSRDSIQVRKWVIIPVDACEVRGVPCDPPLGNQHQNATDFSPVTSATEIDSLAPQITPGNYFKSSSERAAQEDESAEKETVPWSHVKWVRINSLPEPVEIGRIARQTMGYFPPRRKKTGRAISFSSTPRQSLEASTHVVDQIEQPFSRRQSSVGDRPLLSGRHESSENDEVPDVRPMWMRRPGGVGSMSRNIRAPGPDKDYFNTWAKKHLPGLNMDDVPSMSVMGSEIARIGFDRDLAGIVEGSFQEESDTTSPRHQNNGLDKAAAAVETWLRNAWSKRSMAPLIGSTPRQGSTAGQDVGDLIELTTTPGAESTPRREMFDSQP